MVSFRFDFTASVFVLRSLTKSPPSTWMDPAFFFAKTRDEELYHSLILPSLPLCKVPVFITRFLPLFPQRSPALDLLSCPTQRRLPFVRVPERILCNAHFFILYSLHLLSAPENYSPGRRPFFHPCAIPHFPPFFTWPVPSSLVCSAGSSPIFMFQKGSYVDGGLGFLSRLWSPLLEFTFSGLFFGLPFVLWGLGTNFFTPQGLLGPFLYRLARCPPFLFSLPRLVNLFPPSRLSPHSAWPFPFPSMTTLELSSLL